MATKNIEMNLYNGTNYTVLNPKTSASQVTYSNTNTSSIITGTNTQTAIDQLFQHVSNGKSQIASAITDKGVSTSSTASFSRMATNIGKIPTGVDTSDATAVASNVLSGKTFYGSSGSKLTGSMTNRGAVSKTLNAGSSYTIPSGYHNGSGSVRANSLSSQTSGTATASDILSGKTAWVNGNKITGNYTVPSSYKQVYSSTISSTQISYGRYNLTVNCGFTPTIIMILRSNTDYSGNSTFFYGLYYNKGDNIKKSIKKTSNAINTEEFGGSYPNFTLTNSYTITINSNGFVLDTQLDEKLYYVLCAS